jgi:L-alanine-DL-glutamate epimerase-like enolase superfamily enzyme
LLSQAKNLSGEANRTRRRRRGQETKGMSGSDLTRPPRRIGSRLLREFPLDVVRIECERCGRAGSYRRDGLMARFGPDIALPDLLAAHHVQARIAELLSKPASPSTALSPSWPRSASDGDVASRGGLHAEPPMEGPAYAKAGYKPDTGAASRLSGNVKVKARIAELVGAAVGKAGV